MIPKKIVRGAIVVATFFGVLDAAALITVTAALAEIPPAVFCRVAAVIPFVGGLIGGAFGFLQELREGTWLDGK